MAVVVVVVVVVITHDMPCEVVTFAQGKAEENNIKLLLLISNNNTNDINFWNFDINNLFIMF